MNVQIQETRYGGKRLRYYVFDKDGIIFNTEDLYNILNINEPIEQPEEDLAGAILLASSADVDFAMWLQETFEQYRDEAPLRPSDLRW